MNSVILIGRLTRDPELRYTAGSQMAIAKFSIAVDRPARAGKEREADFPRITVFGKQAENCEKFLAKGRMVGIQGRLQTGSYQDRDGKTVYTTDVVADRVEFLEWGDRQNGGNAPKQSQGYHNNSGSSYNNGGSFGGGYSNAPADDFDDEMPDSFQAIDEDVPF